MPRLLKITALGLLAILAIAAWLLLGPAGHFSGNSKYLYIHSRQNTKEAIQQQLKADSVVRFMPVFNLVAGITGYYDDIRPGKYKVPAGMSIIRLVRMLQKGRQEEVKLVVGKLRQPEELAQRLSRYIDDDSTTVMAFLGNADSLKTLGVDANTWMTAMLPNTYYVYWTHSTGTVLRKLKAESDKWWSRQERRNKAEAKGFSPEQIYAIASIVEEETNRAKDKPLVASVYINRLRRGMPLQADPTVRFARKDFESNRVTYEHLRTPSPYNTYLNKGLPPGPICIPSLSTIDSVLNAPNTEYLYFVAKPDFSGYSVFTTNFRDHSVAAKAYQESLNAWLQRKAAGGQPAAGATK